MPISRQRSQPSTAGASSSTICCTSGSAHASSHAPAPVRMASSGSVVPAAATTSPMRAPMSSSTASNTAANSSVLSVNWW